MHSNDKMLKRNHRISENIFFGEPVAKVAKKYGLTRERCMNILHSYCFNKERDVYKGLIKPGGSLPKLEELREYAEEFLYDDSNEPLTRNSQIWKVREFSIKILNALELSKIRTVEELLNSDITVLKRMPMIGKLSIKRIENFIEQNRHLLIQE